jgi:hypothetical protein
MSGKGGRWILEGAIARWVAMPISAKCHLPSSEEHVDNHFPAIIDSRGLFGALDPPKEVSRNLNHRLKSTCRAASIAESKMLKSAY